MHLIGNSSDQLVLQTKHPQKTNLTKHTPRPKVVYFCNFIYSWSIFRAKNSVAIHFRALLVSSVFLKYCQNFRLWHLDTEWMHIIKAWQIDWNGEPLRGHVIGFSTKAFYLINIKLKPASDVIDMWFPILTLQWNCKYNGWALSMFKTDLG